MQRTSLIQENLPTKYYKGSSSVIKKDKFRFFAGIPTLMPYLLNKQKCYFCMIYYCSFTVTGSQKAIKTKIYSCIVPTATGLMNWNGRANINCTQISGINCSITITPFDEQTHQCTCLYLLFRCTSIGLAVISIRTHK